jgi:hypothetical protein
MDKQILAETVTAIVMFSFRQSVQTYFLAHLSLVMGREEGASSENKAVALI